MPSSKTFLHNGVLGIAVVDIHVVEWQKRGLPHSHILIILRSQDKLCDINDYDRIVCVELPDKSTHPEFYNIVTSRMLHGPCGALHLSCPCMVNGLVARVIPRLSSPKLRTPPTATQPTNDGTTTRPSPTPHKCNCWK